MRVDDAYYEGYEINEQLLVNFFHEIIDNTLDQSIVVDKLQDIRWYELYDFLEFLLSYINSNELYAECNLILSEQNSAFSFIDKKLVPISTNIDKANIESAIQSEFDDNHIKNAISKLSEKNPDYANIIGESIDGVEIAIKNVISKLYDETPSSKFGRNIKILKEHKFLDGHPAYIDILNKLYGYASDGGIRHPKSRDYKISKADAVFAIEICSAFISFLKYKTSTTEDI